MVTCLIRKLPFLLIIFCLWLLSSAFTVVGHRGDPLRAPEETFASFNSAFKSGADYVELDLHVSQDNVLVISHDRNLERVTGHNAIVSQTPWAQIKTFTQSNGEPMHSLDDLFAYYQNRPNTKFLIETKKTKKGNPQNMEALIKASVTKYQMENRVMFHSFSLKSLQNLKEELPNAPRIFIAGSLKRLNFEVFQTTTGVNISSNLVNANLIKQLHDLHQRVYVWDEMSENAKQWTWLVNLPIDGVVTNYPQTGNEYREQKATADIKAVDFPGVLVSLDAEESYENPYNLDLVRQPVKPLHPFEVSNLVIKHGEPFYQIGTNRFISAAGFNHTNDLQTALPYLGLTVTPIDNRREYTQLYDRPLAPQPINQHLQVGQNYQVQAVQINGLATWFEVAGHWLSAKQVLVNFQPQASAWSHYLAIPTKHRQALPNLQTLFHPWQATTQTTSAFEQAAIITQPQTWQTQLW